MTITSRVLEGIKNIGPMNIAEIIKLLDDCNSDSVRAEMQKMKQRGQLERTADKQWQLAAGNTTTTSSRVKHQKAPRAPAELVLRETNSPATEPAVTVDETEVVALETVDDPDLLSNSIEFIYPADGVCCELHFGDVMVAISGPCTDALDVLHEIVGSLR